MNTARKKYQVHAELLEKGIANMALEEAPFVQTMARSLNRIERVAAVYLGQIHNRWSNGLQISFDTAEAALLGACEMQRRCAALRQVTCNRVALRIGIHQGIVLQRARDLADNAIEVASLLAVLDEGILASGAVVAAINPELRKLAHPVSDFPPQIAAHTIDWRSEIPTISYWEKSMWPADETDGQNKPYLLLQHNHNTLKLAHNKPVLTIGRGPTNMLALTSNHVSRNHCRLERHADCIVLTDSSSNGTFVTPDKGEETRVTKASLVLTGKGMIFFGREFRGERRGGVIYEVFN